MEMKTKLYSFILLDIQGKQWDLFSIEATREQAVHAAKVWLFDQCAQHQQVFTLYELTLVK